MDGSGEFEIGRRYPQFPMAEQALVVPALDHPAHRPDGDRWQLAALASLVDFCAVGSGGVAVVVALFSDCAAGLPS